MFVKRVQDVSRVALSFCSHSFTVCETCDSETCYSETWGMRKAEACLLIAKLNTNVFLSYIILS